MKIMHQTVLILLLVVTFSAEATEWHMSVDNSRLEFFITYSGLETPGYFRQFATELQFDPVTPADGQLVVTVVILSADMDSADINAEIVGPEWFDVAQYADAQFVSDSIVKIGDRRFIATGRLQLKGIEQLVEVPFTWSQADGQAQLRGELILQRGIFGIGSGEWATSDIIGQNVRVRFDIALYAGVD